MRFLQPDAASWLLAVPLALCAWYLHVHAKRRFRRHASFGEPLRALSRFSSWKRDVTALVASATALLLLVLAMMRPQLMLQTRTPEYEKEDLILVLDRSISMRADDVPPSRFSRAISEIKLFLAHKPDTIDRVGLVGFAGTSLILSPLTRDVDNLMFYLTWIEEDLEPRFGTNIGSALTSARELATKDKQKTRKIFLVISDGDDQGPELPKVLAALRTEQRRVYTIGIGSEGAVPIPIADAEGRMRLLTDDTGNVVRTRLNESTLRNIANFTGGRYIRSLTGTELAPAMHDAVRRERKIIGWQTRLEYRDLYRECLAGAGLALFVLLLSL
jgi:Ca-activated chloride channel family protein